jgi:o-succinylbenzoate---CoA ligase
MDGRRRTIRVQPMTGAAGTGWRRELELAAGDREALLFGGQSLSFAELAREVAITADRLEAEGIMPGDRVGLLAPPSKQGVVLIHAMLDRGVVMVPMNLRWTVAELRYALATARVGWLVVAGGSESLGKALADESRCGLLRLDSSPVVLGGLERMRSPALPEADTVRNFDESMQPSDAALVLFTSGTSGRPKGALLTLGNLRASAEGSMSLLGSDPADRWLCCMPLFHIGGLSILIRSALAGTSVVLHSGFDAQAVDRALDEDGITRVSLVAAMLSRLLEVRGERRSPDALRLVLLGGGPASQALLMRARSLGYPVAPTYGLTEAASQVATRPPDLAPRAPRQIIDIDAEEGETDLAAGLVPLPGTEIRVVDASGKSVEAGDVGEIEVRGPTVMQGYLDDPLATARVLRRGWLATGDLGRLGARGGLRVLDRRSDLIVSGGENIYPAEVESVLVAHPAIAEAGVVGIDDEIYGERPRAYLVLVPGKRVETPELLEFCRERLAKYKLPAQFVVLDALPRTASGKLLRRELKMRGSEFEGS